MSVRVLSLLLSTALCALGQTGGPGTGITTLSTTTVNIFVVTNNTVDVDTFLTQITARLNGAAPLFDQSFPAALGDPTVQAGITQARNALTTAASPSAVTVTGPTQLSTARSLLSSTAATVDSSPTSTVMATTTTFGPANILIGDNAATPFFVAAGDTNIDVKTTRTIPRTVTTTNTYRTTASYLLAGSSNSPAPVPVPPSVVLGLTGLLGAGLHEIRRRRMIHSGRGRRI